MVSHNRQACSIARALEVVGERWTLLVVRDAMLGVTRFDAFLKSLGVARNILADRLSTLVEAGVFERVPYQQRPLRHEYRLTDRGRELAPVVLALMEWGDRHRADEAGPPRLAEHENCGGPVRTEVHCARCGGPLTEAEISTRLSPHYVAHRQRQGREVATWPSDATAAARRRRPGRRTR
ncbi:helix-turn-helix domain-containing protein [Micromonospora sp. KC213]|uniref:winged helix-turn-helix transcriptional regulator n=1 Tax=Micromonospora sp. KC213 TaxID=2530378 RepID=UPI00104A95D8|nr:helix-turn-helix domain-containing protein [Micromonospora sp. KC213]TDC42924.1 transcriptional regulator [Micromonospora sp. KC213]